MDNFQNYIVEQLHVDDAPRLQLLYEACFEFSLLTDGVKPSPTAAEDEFSSFPEGKNHEDKFIFGLISSDGSILGLIETIRSYPDEQTWWVGLMMLSPKLRGFGIGRDFFKWFEQHVIKHGAVKIMLSVVKVNTDGQAFWERQGFKLVHITEPQTVNQRTHKTLVFSKVLDAI